MTNTFQHQIREAAEAILDIDNWKEAMQTSMDGLYKGTTVPVTPLRMMIRYCPTLVNTVFQKCLTTTPGLDEDDEAKVDFEFLDDSFNFKVNPKTIGINGFSFSK